MIGKAPEMREDAEHPGYVVAVLLDPRDHRILGPSRYLDAAFPSSAEEMLGGMFTRDYRAVSVQPWLAHIWTDRKKAEYAAQRARCYYRAAEVVELKWSDEWWTGVDHNEKVRAWQCDECWNAGEQACEHRGGARYCDECGEVRPAAYFALGGDLHPDPKRLRGIGPWRHWQYEARADHDYVGVCDACVRVRAADTINATHLNAHSAFMRRCASGEFDQ